MKCLVQSTDQKKASSGNAIFLYMFMNYIMWIVGPTNLSCISSWAGVQVPSLQEIDIHRTVDIHRTSRKHKPTRATLRLFL